MAAFFVVPFPLFLSATWFYYRCIFTMIFEVSPEPSRRQFDTHAYRVLLPLLLLLCVLLCRSSCCWCIQHCWCFLLLFVIVCGTAKFVAGLMNLIPVIFPSSSKRDYLWCTPWQNLLCRIYGLDLPVSSVITSMRGAKAVFSLTRWSPVYFYMLIGTIAKN